VVIDIVDVRIPYTLLLLAAWSRVGVEFNAPPDNLGHFGGSLHSHSQSFD